MIDVDGKLTASLAGKSYAATERSDFSWTFFLTDKARVTAEGPWRILHNGRIALGDGDHAHKFGLPEPLDGFAECNRLLKGRKIKRISIRQDTGDLTVEFEENTSLEILNVSSGYEGWNLGDGNGLMAIATGGGELALYGAGWEDKEASPLSPHS